MPVKRDDVFIVGAGPTGLVLALYLKKQGVGVRIIDKSEEPGETSRAIIVQARTLELYRQLDLADAIVAAGNKNQKLNMWVKGKKVAGIHVGSLGENLTPYPFMLTYPQDLHERFLIERLAKEGVVVERNTELVGFEDKSDSLVVRLRLPTAEEKLYEVSYLAGCDGAHSRVRHLIGAKFEGGTYGRVFYVADVETKDAHVSNEFQLSLESADFSGWFSYGDNKGRLIGTVKREREKGDRLVFEDVDQRVIENMGLDIDKVNWFSTYRVHHRMVDTYRQGRAFLLGDAAHIHSPAGGQGMNTGIGDSINLAWKLASVIKGQAPDSLLDTYQVERRAFAKKLLKSTDRVFSFVTNESLTANFIRTYVVPILAPIVFQNSKVRQLIFRLVSQMMIEYRNSPLSEGTAGIVCGGERLPWVQVGSSDNFASLSPSWQVHIYGTAKDDLIQWCRVHSISLQIFNYTSEHKKKGLAHNAAYLLRPDTYVAVANPTGSAEVFDRYFSKHQIKLN